MVCYNVIITSATEGKGDDVFTPLCLFVTCKIEDFSSLLVSRFCYSVFVCQLLPGHNFKPIFTKLYEVVEVVSTEKPIDFEVKGHLEVMFLKSSFFISLT